MLELWHDELPRISVFTPLVSAGASNVKRVYVLPATVELVTVCSNVPLKPAASLLTIFKLLPTLCPFSKVNSSPDTTTWICSECEYLTIAPSVISRFLIGSWAPTTTFWRTTGLASNWKVSLYELYTEPSMSLYLICMRASPAVVTAGKANSAKVRPDDSWVSDEAGTSIDHPSAADEIESFRLERYCPAAPASHDAALSNSAVMISPPQMLVLTNGLNLVMRGSFTMKLTSKRARIPSDLREPSLTPTTTCPDWPAAFGTRKLSSVSGSPELTRVVVYASGESSVPAASVASDTAAAAAAYA